MAYAAPIELRQRFLQGSDDEFALYDDDNLAQALAGASSEIDSWRPAGEPTAEALAVLREKCLILARMLAHRDDALDASHPIVRDAFAVRDWLAALASGRVRLAMTSTGETAATASIAAAERTLVYGAAFDAAYLLP